METSSQVALNVQVYKIVSHSILTGLPGIIVCPEIEVKVKVTQEQAMKV
jgi:hypothetical protein